tara:strand:+ start:633 stop:1214 length:582 start_codon:yes stop_codon:yes gene_type:complete
MNDARIYEALVARAKRRSKPEGYAERHHVLPRSLGGSDHISNLVWLTAREHFVAHMLLARIYGGSQWFAVMMFAAGERRVVNSRLYEAAKRKHAAWMSEAYTGRRLNDGHKRAISEGLRGNANTKGKPLAATHRHQISASLKGNTNNAGRTAGEETRAKMSAAKRGRPRSEETKARIRAGVLAANAVRINPNP